VGDASFGVSFGASLTLVWFIVVPPVSGKTSRFRGGR